MSTHILRVEEGSKPFSLEVRTELFECIQDSRFRSRAISDYLKLCDQYLWNIVHQSPWAKQWGVEDAYQYAVTFLLEKSHEATSPEQLPQYRDVQNAIAEEAAKYIYSFELSPYLIKTHGYGDHCFDSDTQLTEEFDEPQIQDELIWQRICRIAQDTLEKADLRILALYMERPGFIPSAEEIAQRLSLKLETAKRYIRRFIQKMKAIPDLVALFQGLDCFAEDTEETPEVIEATPSLVAVASEKVVSMTQWRRAKIQRSAQTLNVVSLNLRRALNLRILRESAFSLSHPSPSHPTIGLHHQCRENVLLKVLNKPTHFASQTWEETVNRLIEGVSSSRPWDDWNPDTGDCVA